jgi:phage terminase small subunit
MFELSQEQLALWNALTPLQQRVCTYKLEAKYSDAECYRRAGGRAKSDGSVRTSVSEIMANPNVVAYLNAMAKSSVTDKVMKRQEMAERLSLLAQTKVTDVIDFHPGKDLIDPDTGDIVKGQTFWSLKDPEDMGGAGLLAIKEVTAGRNGLTIKLHDQMVAMKQLSDLAGMNAPIKTETVVKRSLEDFYDETDNPDK